MLAGVRSLFLLSVAARDFVRDGFAQPSADERRGAVGDVDGFRREIY